MMVPTIELKLKVESLPEWDGNHDTTINYFWEVSQVANLLGWLPHTLGFWLPSHLKKDSQVHLWFSTLATERQAEMRSHYLVYLQAIKDKYLGKRWQLLMNLQFEKQMFRQQGHKRESPQKFLGRRIKFAHLLLNTDDGGPLEVFLIMRKALIAWSTIIVLENVNSTEELYERVNTHEEALVEVFEHGRPDTLTVHNLSSALKRLGYAQNAPASTNKCPYRRVNLTEVEAEGELRSPEADLPTETIPELDPSNGESTLRQVYQVLKRKQ